MRVGRYKDLARKREKWQSARQCFCKYGMVVSGPNKITGRLPWWSYSVWWWRLPVQVVCRPKAMKLRPFGDKPVSASITFFSCRNLFLLSFTCQDDSSGKIFLLLLLLLLLQQVHRNNVCFSPKNREDPFGCLKWSSVYFMALVPFEQRWKQAGLPSGWVELPVAEAKLRQNAGFLFSGPGFPISAFETLGWIRHVARSPWSVSLWKYQLIFLSVFLSLLPSSVCIYSGPLA